MAVTAHVYTNALYQLATQHVSLNGDALKVMLCTSGYTPNQATHAHKSDVTSEVTGTGYTAGGAALSSAALTVASGIVMLDCDDITWNNSTLTARYAVFYDDTPSGDVNKPLLCYWDFGADTTSSAAPFTLTIASTGLLQMTGS